MSLLIGVRQLRDVPDYCDPTTERRTEGFVCWLRLEPSTFFSLLSAITIVNPKKKPAFSTTKNWRTITMRFSFAISALLATLKVGESFAPSSQNAVGRWGTVSVLATVEADTEASAVETTEIAHANGTPAPSGAISAADIRSRMEAQLEKLRQKDSKSPKLSKEVSERIQLEGNA